MSMGTSYQEIIDDFMASFYNYYGVTKDGDERKYNYIVENNIKAMLGVIAGGEDPATADLAASAYEYLVKYGMSESAINILIDKLS